MPEGSRIPLVSVKLEPDDSALTCMGTRPMVEIKKPIGGEATRRNASSISSAKMKPGTDSQLSAASHIPSRERKERRPNLAPIPRTHHEPYPKSHKSQVCFRFLPKHCQAYLSITFSNREEG